MAGEYQRQVRQTASPVNVPNPASARSGIGEGLQALGQGMERAADITAQAQDQIEASRHRMAMEEKRRAAAHAATVWAGQNADAEVGLTQKIRDLRNGSAAGAYGHDQKATDAIGEWEQSQLAAIPPEADPETYDRLSLIVHKSAARYRAEEQGWAAGERNKYEGVQAQKIGEGIDRDLYSGLSGAKVDTAFTKIDVLTASLDMPGNARDAVAAKLKRSAIMSAFDGLQDRGDDGALTGMLANPQLTQYLEKDDISRYTRAAEAIGKSRATAAEQAQNDVQAQARDQINALKIRIDAGDVPTAAEMRLVQDNAKAAGLPVDDLTRVGVLATQTDTARRFQVMDPAGRRRSLDGYQAAIANGTATAEQRIAAKSLTAMVDKDESQQAEKLRTLIGQGVPGRVQALGSIQGDGETRFNVAEKLQKGWGVLATLPPFQQKAAFEGWEVRKDRPKDFGTEVEIKRDFGGFVGQALPTQYGAVMQAAWNIYAANRNARGLTGYDANEFRTTIRIATGARQRPGGGALEGGINFVRGKAVQLPDFMTAGEFDQALSRVTFAAARDGAGQPVAKADVLTHFQPSYIGDNERGEPVYRFVDARGHPLRADGNRIFETSFGQRQ